MPNLACVLPRTACRCAVGRGTSRCGSRRSSSNRSVWAVHWCSPGGYKCLDTGRGSGAMPRPPAATRRRVRPLRLSPVVCTCGGGGGGPGGGGATCMPVPPATNLPCRQPALLPTCPAISPSLLQYHPPLFQSQLQTRYPHTQPTNSNLSARSSTQSPSPAMPIL
jgi:hypothetical protein